MARSNKTRRKPIQPDPIYSSKLVTSLINRIMKDGKKKVAANLVYTALEQVKQELKADNPLNVLRQALDNIKPIMEVRSRRVGGAAYQVPMPVRGERKESLAIRWLIFAARARANKEYKSFSSKLAAELKDAYNNEGGAVKKKMETHKMAESNKAFAHFRW